MRAAIVTALALAASSASADARLSVGGTLQARFAPTFGPYAAGSGWVAARWWDRLHTGLRASLGAGGGVGLVEETGEVGLWLSPSPKLDVLLAWRAGHAYLRITGSGARPIAVHAFALAPVVELALHVTPALDIRVMPLVVSGYYASLWQITGGPEIGVAWTF